MEIHEAHKAAIAHKVMTGTPVWDRLDSERDRGLLTTDDYRDEAMLAYVTGKMNALEMERYQRAILFW